MSRFARHKAAVAVQCPGHAKANSLSLAVLIHQALYGARHGWL